ncbi:hypothetical protein SM007_39490, partial [Streptomyces avermitilis]
LETAIKATAKGGIGKLRQRSRGQVPYYEEYPALKRETWRPDIRAAVLANQRVGLHRKLMKTAGRRRPLPDLHRHRRDRLPLARPVPAGHPAAHQRRQARAGHVPARCLADPFRRTQRRRHHR